MRSFVAHTLAAFVLLGCSPSDVVGDAQPTSSYPKLGEPARVVEISPGEGEKHSLRWAPKPGTSGVIHMTIETEIQGAAGGQEMTGTMSFDLTLRISVDEISDSSIGLTTRVDEARVAVKPDTGGVAPGMEAAMKGLVWQTRIDPVGRRTSTDMAAGEDGPNASTLEQLNLDSSLKHVGIAFPDQPVAIGGTWQVLDTRDEKGATVLVHSRYELVAFDGRTGRAKLTKTERVDDQPMEGPTGVATIEMLRGTGAGEITFDLGRPMMTTVSLKENVDMTVTLTGTKMTMSAASTVKATAKP